MDPQRDLNDWCGDICPPLAETKQDEFNDIWGQVAQHTDVHVILFFKSAALYNDGWIDRAAARLVNLIIDTESTYMISQVE